MFCYVTTIRPLATSASWIYKYQIKPEIRTRSCSTYFWVLINYASPGDLFWFEEYGNSFSLRRFLSQFQLNNNYIHILINVLFMDPFSILNFQARVNGHRVSHHLYWVLLMMRRMWKLTILILFLSLNMGEISTTLVNKWVQNYFSLLCLIKGWLLLLCIT